MPVLFDQIPSTTRGPLAYIEIRPSRSGNVTALKPFRALFIGQRLSTGTVLAGVSTLITSWNQAIGYFGAGSQLSNMLGAWFANNKGTEVWAVAVDDDGAAVADVRTLTVSGGGASAPAGTIAYYVGGRRVVIGVTKGEANNSIALKLRNAINADTNMSVVASGGGATCVLTAKNKGTLGFELDMRDSYQANEALPAGLAIAEVFTTPGTGVVVYTSSLFAGLAETQFDVVCAGANDATNLGVIISELTDRWDGMRMLEGGVITGFSGDLSASLAQGLLLNTPFSAQLPMKASPTPSWVVGGALAGVVGFFAAQDPARGFHTLPLKGVLAPALADRFSRTEQEQLLYGGMATYRIGGDGSVQVHRLVTNYRLGPGGAPDEAFLDITTLYTLSFLRWSWRTNLINKYPRHKLADDDKALPANQPIMTPERGRAEAVAWFGAMQQLGLVENIDQFKADLVVERNASNPNRLDFHMPVNLVNQTQVIGSVIEFTL